MQVFYEFVIFIAPNMCSFGVDIFQKDTYLMLQILEAQNLRWDSKVQLFTKLHLRYSIPNHPIHHHLKWPISSCPKKKVTTNTTNDRIQMLTHLTKTTPSQMLCILYPQTGRFHGIRCQNQLLPIPIIQIRETCWWSYPMKMDYC